MDHVYVPTLSLTKSKTDLVTDRHHISHPYLLLRLSERAAGATSGLMAHASVLLVWDCSVDTSGQYGPFHGAYS